jgi:hypothetical protein
MRLEGEINKLQRPCQEVTGLFVTRVNDKDAVRGTAVKIN